MNKITAQVAVEAVASCPSAYDANTIAVVLADGIEAGVSDFYLDMIRGEQA